MTNSQLIWNTVVELLGSNFEMEFKRADIKARTGIPNPTFGSTFHGMRVDPGKAPKPAKDLQKVFRSLDAGNETSSSKRGTYVLSDIGLALIRKQRPRENLAQRIQAQAEILDREGSFPTNGFEDSRKRALREIVVRYGQPEFRKNLIQAYQSKCAVTQFDAVWALEAAHIYPYSGKDSNATTNGLLLRSDIHTLFDLNLLAIRPESYTIALAPELLGTEYGSLKDKPLHLPAKKIHHPDPVAILQRWRTFSSN